MPALVTALTEVVETTRVENAQAAATSDFNTSAVDLATFRGNSVRFIALFGAIAANAVTSVSVSHRDTTSDSWEEVDDAEVDIAEDDDNGLAIIDVVRPKRYVRCSVDRGTANAAVDGIIAEVYYSRTAPAPQNGDVAAQSIVHG